MEREELAFRGFDGVLELNVKLSVRVIGAGSRVARGTSHGRKVLRLLCAGIGLHVSSSGWMGMEQSGLCWDLPRLYRPRGLVRLAIVIHHLHVRHEQFACSTISEVEMCIENGETLARRLIE